MLIRTLQTVTYTSFALIAFAGNSVLCRLALGGNKIDAASFTSIRLVSGAVFLAILLSMLNREGRQTATGSWGASVALFLYAVSFSYAYISLDTGTGALILFAAMQMTIILRSLLFANKLHPTEWIGGGIAFSGLVYFMFPGLTTPSLQGFILMIGSGVAWGIYTLKGKGSQDPLSDTAYNFMRTLPLVAILIYLQFNHVILSPQGVLLAVLSGAIASGIGYAIWYIAVKRLADILVAVLPLLVPIVATFGGIIFAGEVISQRLVVATMVIFGGILIVVLGKHYVVQRAVKKIQ